MVNERERETERERERLRFETGQIRVSGRARGGEGGGLGFRV